MTGVQTCALPISSSVADRDTVTYFKRYLIGSADISDSLEKLDRLTNEEFMTAVVQTWKVAKQIQSEVEDAKTKIDELVRKFDEGRAGTFSTSATQKCHPKPTIHTTSRPRKESS